MDVFGDTQFALSGIGESARAEIAKNRALIEQKEKGVDMAKTVGETKLFMSGHGIANALKPLKPRIKKLAGRKANEFKKAVSNKISDFLDGDGGKARRLKEFKDSQEAQDDSFVNTRKRFGKLSKEDKDDIRENLKNDPEFTPKEDVADLEEEDQEAAKLKNTQLLRDQVSQKETENFVENDANEAAENEATSTIDNVKNAISDAGSAAKNAVKNVVGSSEDVLNKSTNALNKDAIKTSLKSEAKAMAESTAEEDVGDTAAGLASAALDEIPGADILGAILGAGIAIKKAVQVRRLEKKDENLIASKPGVGVLQQVGL